MVLLRGDETNKLVHYQKGKHLLCFMKSDKIKLIIFSIGGYQLNEQIKFIHAADTHLDSPFHGMTNLPDTIFEQVRQSTFHAFDYLIKIAIQKNVDFILLVGDLFDHERQSLKAQVYLKNAFEKLESHSIQVFLSYGNHDHINGNPYQISFPHNVHIFPSEKVTSFAFYKNGQRLASIYGFSYENRSITKNKINEYKLENAEVPFHIAMLHGSIVGNKLHDPYAPFKLTDLYNTHFDYWALGHIHKKEILSETPPIIYPGNTQGRHRNESGEKGFYYIEMSENKLNKQFIKSNVIQFEAISIDLNDEETIDQIRDKINKKTNGFNSMPILFYVQFSGNSYHFQLHQDGVLEEIVMIFNEENMLAKQWSYIYKYVFELTEAPVMKSDHFFIGEVEKSLSELDVNEANSELFNHREMRRYVDPIDEQDIKKQAKELLINELTESRRNI